MSFSRFQRRKRASQATANASSPLRNGELAFAGGMQSGKAVSPLRFATALHVGSLFALISLCVLWAGCVAPKAPSLPEPAPVWPAPPEKPKITFVQNIACPSDVGVKISGIARFAHWVTGSQKGNEPLVKPFGVAVDEKGDLCVVDTATHAVSWFDRAKTKWHRWDKIGKITFESPVAVARQNGVIYVADSSRAAVVAFDDQGKLLFQITNKLERPSGLVISGGHLFIADSRRHSIVQFDLRGVYVSEFGQRGTGPGEFNFPTHLAADAGGLLYVTDSLNNRIEVFDSNGHFQRQIGSTGDSTGHFSRPKGVAVDAFGHIYVVDALFANIQIFDREGRFLLTVGEAGSQAGQFWLPNGIAIDRNNRIFVTDTYNHRLQVLKYLDQP